MDAKISLQVICSGCGGLLTLPRDYSVNAVQYLQDKIQKEHWICDKKNGNLCPDCQKELHKRNDW